MSLFLDRLANTYRSSEGLERRFPNRIHEDWKGRDRGKMVLEVPRTWGAWSDFESRTSSDRLLHPKVKLADAAKRPGDGLCMSMQQSAYTNTLCPFREPSSLRLLTRSALQSSLLCAPWDDHLRTLGYPYSQGTIDSSNPSDYSDRVPHLSLSDLSKRAHRARQGRAAELLSSTNPLYLQATFIK